MTAIRAIKQITESSLALDISEPLGDALTILKSFLKKSDRQLRLAALDAISAIIRTKGVELEVSELSQAMQESSDLISAEDMGVTNLALLVVKDIVQTRPEISLRVLDNILEKFPGLLGAATLQDLTLERIEHLLTAVLNACSEKKSQILAAILDFGKSSSSVLAATSTARCVAELCLASNDSSLFVEVEAKVLEGLQIQNTEDSAFYFYCIKEFGVRNLITEKSKALNTIDDGLKSESAAASMALGGLAASDDKDMLEFVITNLSSAKEQKVRYFMLKALNEALRICAIQRHANLSESMIIRLTEVLHNISVDPSCNEEIHHIVGECHGHIALVSPDNVLPYFSGQLRQESSAPKMVALSGLRNTIMERPHPIDDRLHELLPIAMVCLSDADVQVRRAATLLLGAVAHSKPSLIISILPDSMKDIILQTKPDPSLVRIVNLGPFKHRVDDGLEQRKTAFECLGVLISKCWNTLTEHSIILDAVCEGLKDDYDVKLKCHDLIIALTKRIPEDILLAWDKMEEPLKETLNTKMKTDAVKQELDRNEDMLRSCLRCIDALSRLDSLQENGSFKTFMDSVLNSSHKIKLEAIVKERRKVEDI